MPIDNSRYTLFILLSSFEQPERVTEPLREALFNVTEAATPDEIIRLSGIKPPDMIVVRMKDMTEEEHAILLKFKRNRYTRDVALLLIADTTEHTHIPDCLLSGTIDFIFQPFHPKELIIRIQHQLLWQDSCRTLNLQNQKLQKAVKYRDRLYSVIAHDLRAPIGTIKMINSSLEDHRTQITDPQIRKYFDMINETTEEAFNLLENLLRWSRTQRGKTQLYSTTFNVTKATREVVSLFTNIASAKKVKLNNLIREDVCIYADEDMVKTVLRNLISNAIKFSFAGGNITIHLQETTESVLISVEDNGQGIKEELQSRLLKAHEHITTYGTQNEKGSGLGLALCREFIKMNKGKLWFTSKENQGTTFFFTLPKHPSPSVAPTSR